MAPPSPSETHNINGNKSRESRRRSLLPQRSVSGSSLQSASPSDSEGPGFGSNGIATEASAASTARSRLGSVAEGARRSDDEGDAVSLQRRAALDALEGGSSSVPSAMSAQTRDASSHNRQSRMVPKPGSSKGSMPPPSGLARASSLRMPSTNTSATSRPDRTSRMPPPSAAASAVSRSQSRHVASTSTGSARPSSRSSTTATASGRPPSSSSVRPPSASSTTGRTSRSEGNNEAIAGLTRSSSVRTTSNASVRPSGSTVPTLQAKPQFTTYQQHYSPKKDLAPKPLTSSFLPKAAPATQPSFSRSQHQLVDAGTLRQQTQLLQLSILHSQALSSFVEFRASAERKLRSRFDRLVQRSAAVQEAERGDRMARNVDALNDWGGGTGAGLQENVRVLSGVLRELTALQNDLDSEINAEDDLGDNARPGSGRFDRLLTVFVEWMSIVEHVWEVRCGQNSRHLHDHELNILEHLPRTWQNELAALQRKVSLLLRELDCLDTAVPGSSVAGVMERTREVLTGMIEEMRTMKALSNVVMEKEMAWVNSEVGRIEIQDSGGQLAAAVGA